jgi:Recombination endonuclease VII
MQADPTTETKLCTICHKEKPLDAFPASTPRGNLKRGHCYECRCAYTKARYRRLKAEGIDPNKAAKARRHQARWFPLATVELPPHMKLCSTCKLSKSLDDFVRNSSRLDFRGERCKHCDALAEQRAKDKYWLAPAYTPESKYCCYCKEKKPAADFHRCRGQIDWLAKVCKQCVRRSQYVWRYGLSSYDQFLALLAGQGNGCAICGLQLDPAADRRSLDAPELDHNHQTRKVRGILCGLCNKAFGVAEQKADWFAKAQRYFDLHKGSA